MTQADIFLKVEGASQGLIKGEARDAGHHDEIDVLAWNWGMEGNRIHGPGSHKTAVSELKITKRVDKASTALMAALRSNEVIKKATLMVRKAGGAGPVEYYMITMERARITALLQRGGDSADPSALNEEVSIAFSKFAVEYKPQGADGQYRGGTTFEMDIFDGN
ncbi:MAG TPA: type VI secretion system tube protein Hcp [Telluria sp.]|jgi:type VI secretion system secreted protein Hcp